jgi:hypothetical protein
MWNVGNALKALLLVALLSAVKGVEIMDCAGLTETKSAETRRAENLARYLKKKAEREESKLLETNNEPQALLALPGPCFPHVNFNPPTLGDPLMASSQDSDTETNRFHIHGRSHALFATLFFGLLIPLNLQADLLGPKNPNKFIGPHRTNSGEHMGLFPHPCKVPRAAQLRPGRVSRPPPLLAFPTASNPVLLVIGTLTGVSSQSVGCWSQLPNRFSGTWVEGGGGE